MESFLNRNDLKNILVSIIVPVYNAEKYVDRCLTSILGQSYGSIEIIIINDGAEDSSLEICLEFAQKDNRITVLSTENKGASTARNIGLEVARGGVYHFC